MIEQLRLLCLLLTLALSLTSWGLDVSLLVQQHSYCGRASGLVYSSVTGGVPPYTYQWSNGSTEPQLVGVEAGVYSLTVTDSQLDQATADGEVLLRTSYDYTAFGSSEAMMHCPGDPMQTFVYTGMDEAGVQPAPTSIYGPNPYNFDAPGLTHLGQSTICPGPNGVVFELLNFTGIAPGSITISYTDAAGCPGSMDLTVGGPMVWPNVQVLDVTPSCPNWNTGSITFSSQGLAQFGHYSVKLRADPAPSPCGNTSYNFNGQEGTDGQTISGLEAGDYWLIISNDVMDLYQNGSAYSYLECKDSILVTVPALTEACGRVTGRLYIDESADCIMGGGENRIPESIIEITPGPQYVTTSASGQYTVYLPYGTYSFAEQNPTYVQSCPADATITTGNSQTVNIGCAGGVPLDVQVSMSNGPARPGFDLNYAISLANLTSASPGPQTLSVTFDPALGFLWAIPSPTSIVGNIVTWSGSSTALITPFAGHNVYLRLQVPSDVGLIGTTLNTSATLVTTNTDVDPTNNTFNSAQLVTGSYDPNDKVATTSSGASATRYFIGEDEWIDYTIRFQNTGTDTAFNVIITDTLPSTLDPASIQWGATSHSCTRTLSGAGVLKFIFPNILLPDSNVNEAASHGFVSFRIKPFEPVLPGTIIENIANIYFDFNPPIITEPSVLVAEFSTGVPNEGPSDVQVFPNPNAGSFVVRSHAKELQSIELLAMDGRSIRTLSMQGERMTIDITDLATGHYLLRLFNSTRTTTLPIIKM